MNAQQIPRKYGAGREAGTGGWDWRQAKGGSVVSTAAPSTPRARPPTAHTDAALVPLRADCPAAGPGPGPERSGFWAGRGLRRLRLPVCRRGGQAPASRSCRRDEAGGRLPSTCSVYPRRPVLTCILGTKHLIPHLGAGCCRRARRSWLPVPTAARPQASSGLFPRVRFGQTPLH